ncbi:MAG: hypothetical protein Q9169_000289 [Polycauliona sp. 2 TL-2023]
MALLVSLLFLAGKSVAAPEIALPINAQVPPVARINEPFNFTFSASTFTSSTGNPDYVVTDAPAWLHFDASSRTFSGTPGSDAAGSPKFNLAAMDTTGSTTMPVTLVVVTDAGPTLGTPIEEQLSAHNGFQPPNTIILPHSSALAVSFSSNTFVNTNHDTVYYAMCANNTPLPSWITFDAGSLSFSGTAPQTTSPDELPQTFNFHFTASDVEGFSAAVASFRVTVENHVLMFEDGYYAVNVTPGLAFEYNKLQGALRLDDAPVDLATVRQVQIETPSWMSFDKNTWALSGNPPLSATSENISLTATDIYGEVAVTTVLLQVETDATSDLFDGIPHSIDTTMGMDFNYTFNSIVTTNSDAQLSVDLGLATSWLRYDDVNQRLSGRIPRDLLPQDFVLNVTVSQGSKFRSEPLTIRIQDSTHSANGRSNDAPDPTADSSRAVSSTTSAPSSSRETESRPHKNDSRMAAAIAVPVVVACLLLILGCCFLARRRRRRRRTEADWSWERKQKISRPFRSNRTGFEEHTGDLSEKPVPAVEKPSRAPFIDLPGFRASMASKRHSLFRLSKGTTDEAVQTPNIDSWDLYTRGLSAGEPKVAEQRRFSLVPEERASSTRGKRGVSSNKQAFRSSKLMGITNGSLRKRNETNRRRSDMSFATNGLLANHRTSGLGHGRNRSSMGKSPSFARIARGVGHGNGGPSLGGDVKRSWRNLTRSPTSWSTTNTSDLSSHKKAGSITQSSERLPTGTLEHLSLPVISHKRAKGCRDSIRVVTPSPDRYSRPLHAFHIERARNGQSKNTFFAAGPSSRASSHLQRTYPVQSPILSPTQSMDSATSMMTNSRNSRFERSAAGRTHSGCSSLSAPIRRNPIEPRPSPRKRDSDTLRNDRGNGLGALIANAITQRLNSNSKNSSTSSDRRFRSARASGEFSNPSPEIGLEEVKDEDGSRRWRYPDVHPNPLGLHTPSATPPPGSPDMTGEQQGEGYPYIMARQILLEPRERRAERTGGRSQALDYLHQPGIGGRHGPGASGPERISVGGSRGQRPVSVDNELFARGASMRGNLVRGHDGEEHENAFV